MCPTAKKTSQNLTISPEIQRLILPDSRYNEGRMTCHSSHGCPAGVYLTANPVPFASETPPRFMRSS